MPADVPPAAAADDGRFIGGMKPGKHEAETAAEGEKKPRKRSGTASKGKDGKGPAKPDANGKTARPDFDPGHYAEKWDVWRVNEKGGSYFMRDPYQQEWMCLTKTDLEEWLEGFGLEKGDQRQRIKEVERLIQWVQARRKLDMVLSLAGHRPGVVKIDTLRILVPKGPELLEPKEGNWDVLRGLLEGMFHLPIEGPEMPPHFQVFVKGAPLSPERTLEIWRSLVKIVTEPDGEGDERSRYVFDQTPIVFSWLKLTLEVLYRRMAGEDVARNGQALIIASKPDGGKTLLIGLLKRLLGGRMADVEQFLTGKTPFNNDATSSELLRLSDAPLSVKMEDRLLLGEFIKHVVAETEHRVHPKGKDASYTLPLVQRLVWAHNDDPDNLRQVPPMKPELRDKVLWVRANAVEMTAPTAGLNDYMTFGNALKGQLPALAWWLMNKYQVPAALVGNRFGMLGVQEPSLIRELYEDSPAAEFLELLDAARWEVAGEQLNLWAYVATRTDTEEFGDVDEERRVWTGGHLKLQKLLTGEGCNMASDFVAMFKREKPHRLLGRVEKDVPTRVARDRNKRKRWWKLTRPLQ